LLLLCLLVLQSVSRAAEPGGCIALQRVDIEDRELVSRSRQADLVAPFIGRCIDAALTRGLLSAISNRLIEDGYVTSRPYLEEQDISDGVIEIRILPGRIEAIVDAGTGRGDRNLAAAFLFAGENLNLRELETGLEALQSVESVEATIEIRPGESPGGSIVAVDRRVSDALRMELGVNAQTDLENRLSFLLSLDNILNINDILQLRLNDGELRETLQSNRSRELGYSFALGAWQFELRHSEIEYRQRLQGLSGSFLSEGEAGTDMLGVGVTLARAQSYRLAFAFALEVEDTENFLEDVRIEVSSYRTSQLRIGLRHDWYPSWGQWSNELAYHRGLDAFGAREDEFFDDLEGGENPARLQFEKFVLDSRLRYFFAAPGWSIDSRFYLQYSEDILFAADKLTLGSPYTVRGYASALSGSNAGYLRGDIVYRIGERRDASAPVPSGKNIALSLGIDYGEVKCETDNPDLCGEIYGTGIGILIWDANFSANLQWGHPLKRLSGDIGEKDRWLLDLRWSI
jgi:hemolysin activation/secretion protein